MCDVFFLGDHGLFVSLWTVFAVSKYFEYIYMSHGGVKASSSKRAPFNYFKNDRKKKTLRKKTKTKKTTKELQPVMQIAT